MAAKTAKSEERETLQDKPVATVAPGARTGSPSTPGGETPTADDPVAYPARARREDVAGDLKKDQGSLDKLQKEYETLKEEVATTAIPGYPLAPEAAQKLARKRQVVVEMDALKRKHDLP